MIKLEEIGKDSCRYEVRGEANDKLIGLIMLDVDGFFYFVTQGEGNTVYSYFSQDLLKAIYDELYLLNEPYQRHLENYFSEQQRLKDEAMDIGYPF